MSTSISKEFTGMQILKFAFPSIIMLFVSSIYSMVDVMFVSNYVGEDAMSAINIVYPYINVFQAICFMMSSGSGAIIGRKLGMGKKEEAFSNLSLIYLLGGIIGAVIGIIGLVFGSQIVNMLGATERLYGYAIQYQCVTAVFAPMCFFQMFSQFFFVTAGRPHIGLVSTLGAGAANIVLDYIFIVLMNMGVAGAALGTGLSYCVPGVWGLIYFKFCNNPDLHFGKIKWDGSMVGETCTNGSSEMVTNVALAITTYLFNIVLLDLIGEDGVAAVTIILYLQFLQIGVFLGYSGGVAPIISYNYGEENEKMLKKVFKTSIIFISVCSVVTFLLSVIFPDVLVGIFLDGNSSVYPIARHGLILFSFSCLLSGINIFSSSLFTALSNGKVSALISFLRTLVFIVGAVLILPRFLDVDGVWLAVPVAEALTFFVTIYLLIKLRPYYRY